MGRVFTTLQRLKDSCLDTLSARFTCWTKPLTSSLLLQTVANLSRSKSELVAENAILRQQLIILKRQVKRPSFTKSDRMLLVLLARLIRTWQQALVIVQPDTRLARAAGVLSPVLEAHVQGIFEQAESRRRNDRLDQADGERQSSLESRTHPRGTAETGPASVQASCPEGHAERSHPPATRSEVEHVSAQSRRAGLGV